MRYRSYEKLNIAESRLLPFVSWLPKQVPSAPCLLPKPCLLPWLLPKPCLLPKQGAEVKRLTLDTGGKHNASEPRPQPSPSP